MYTNIPTQQIPNTLAFLCEQKIIEVKLSKDIIALTKAIIQQNYFRLQEKIYTQTEGMAMGVPTSSVLSVLYIQHLENMALYEILIRYRIIGYYRYVDDLLHVFDSRINNIHDVLQDFDTATPKLRFTLEEENDNKLNSLDIAIIRDNNSIYFNIYRKPTATDTFIPADSCHPNEH
jgi:hypothetical protein